jgi:para-nitrobenzyl esterase
MWQTLILDGLPAALHTAELQFRFDNTKRCEPGTGTTAGGWQFGRELLATRIDLCSATPGEFDAN